MNNQDKKALKAKAHKLKPVVIIGQHGLTDAVLQEIDVAITAHELIKVRLNAEDNTERASMIATICDKLEAEFIQKIGHVAIFYRAGK